MVMELFTLSLTTKEIYGRTTQRIQMVMELFTLSLTTKEIYGRTTQRRTSLTNSNVDFVDQSLTIPGYEQEMVPKIKDWAERLNPDNILPNFNTERILVPESQAINESLETLNTLESSKDSKAEFLTLLPPLKKPSGSFSKLKDNAIDLSTPLSKRETRLRGGVLTESSQSNESPFRKKYNTCGSDHNEFDHFKRETHQIAHLVPGQWMLKEYDWCQELSTQICRATRKKSQAPEMIMSFVRVVENQNDVKVKQVGTDNGTEFRNHELENFCDEKEISQIFSSPYTPEQNSVAERKNRTLIEAARTMLNGSILLIYVKSYIIFLSKLTQL
nr:retrovirus-related Pol polyprotein from transposon TNT 1-94 [Tanacetum cinerariifolium]